jgi:hypothetical protein
MRNVQIRAPFKVRQPGVVVVTGITIGACPGGASTKELVAVDMYAARLAELPVRCAAGIVMDSAASAVVFGVDATDAGGGAALMLPGAQPPVRRARLTAMSRPFIVHLGERHGC